MVVLVLTLVLALCAPCAAADPREVSLAQRYLGELGYYEGQPTGQLDRSTRDALRAFQRDHGLKPTGQLTPEVLRALREEAEGCG